MQQKTEKHQKQKSQYKTHWSRFKAKANTIEASQMLRGNSSRLVSRRVQNKHHKLRIVPWKRRGIRKREVRVLGFLRERIEAIYGKKRKPEVTIYVVARMETQRWEALEGKSHLFGKYYNDLPLFLLFINLNFTIKQKLNKIPNAINLSSRCARSAFTQSPPFISLISTIMWASLVVVVVVPFLFLNLKIEIARWDPSE